MPQPFDDIDLTRDGFAVPFRPAPLADEVDDFDLGDEEDDVRDLPAMREASGYLRRDERGL